MLWLIALIYSFLSLWIVLPGPSLFFLRLAVAAPEVSPLIGVISAIALVDITEVSGGLDIALDLSKIIGIMRHCVVSEPVDNSAALRATRVRRHEAEIFRQDAELIEDRLRGRKQGRVVNDER